LVEQLSLQGAAQACGAAPVVVQPLMPPLSAAVILRYVHSSSVYNYTLTRGNTERKQEAGWAGGQRKSGGHAAGVNRLCRAIATAA
jgi:hypothetical protein